MPNLRAELIFNPTAGSGDGARLVQLVPLIAARYELHVDETTPSRSAASITRDALERGVDVVFACGGDGTISAVADALVGTKVPLGVLPGGTANSIATALGLPRDLYAACEAILGQPARAIDVARVNGSTMVLVATVGFHADVVKDTSRDKKNLLGRFAYIASGLARLSELSPFDVEIETEEHHIHCRATAVTVANIAPPHTVYAQGPGTVVFDDGLLDVTIIAVDTALQALSTSIHLLRKARDGAQAEREEVGFFRCRRARVTTSPLQRLMVDGEVVGEAVLDAEVVPGGLLVLAPPALDAAAPRIEGDEAKLATLPEISVERTVPPVGPTC